MLALLTSPDAWISLLVLTAMETVLGIDNIIFITILCARLPRERQLTARRLGIAAALLSRLVLLFAIAWVMRLTEPLFDLIIPWSGKNLILLFGGGFLLFKATREIHHSVEHADGVEGATRDALPAAAAPRTMALLLVQVMLLDVVFSLDSVITAVGMASHVPVMVAAMVAAMVVMLVFAGPIGNFVVVHPTIRVLALAFLVLIGVMLIIESTGQHVSKGYIYSAMAFSFGVELLNMRMRKKQDLATVA